MLWDQQTSANFGFMLDLRARRFIQPFGLFSLQDLKDTFTLGIYTRDRDKDNLSIGLAIDSRPDIRIAKHQSRPLLVGSDLRDAPPPPSILRGG
jgi:hypothetical protein